MACADGALVLAEGGDCFTPAGLRAVVADDRGGILNGFGVACSSGSPKGFKTGRGTNGEIGAKLGRGDSVGSGGKLIAIRAVGLGMVVVC